MNTTDRRFECIDCSEKLPMDRLSPGTLDICISCHAELIRWRFEARPVVETHC